MNEHEVIDLDNIPESPRGLYIIFVKEGEALFMGEVVGLTAKSALIHPWDFMFGGIDEEQVRDLTLADFDQFHCFDDMWAMDDFNLKHYWKNGATK